MWPMRVLLKIQKSEPPGLDRLSKWVRQFNDFLKCVKDPLLWHAGIPGCRDKNWETVDYMYYIMISDKPKWF